MIGAAVVLRIDNLSLTLPYAPGPLIAGWSCSLGPGDLGLLEGPSGSGRTLAGLSACGFLPLWTAAYELSGVIELDGRAVVQGDPPTSAGLVLENPYAQLSGLKRTVRGELALPLESRGVPRDRIAAAVEEWADRLGIGGLLDRRVRRLSGGELQRVLAAAALLAGPRFLFLDRPLTELDRGFRPAFLSLLRNYLGETGGAALMAEDPWLLPPDTAGVPCPLHPGEPEPSVEPPRVRPASEHDGRPALQVERLSFSYEPGTPLIEDISFTVRRGELAFLTGPNGAGKSTLAGLVCGLIAPDRGRILVDGVSVDDVSERERFARIGYQFQDPDLHICRRTVREELALSAAWGRPAWELAGVLGLDAVMDTHPLELGMAARKRLGLALAAGGNRSVLLLDEPTQYQDARGFARVAEAVETCRAAGVAVLMIAHDDRCFETWPDAAVIRLVRAGTP